MGVVYLAESAVLGRRVGLKVLAPEIAAEPVFGERFADESRIAASIGHPNIIPIYEAGDADGVLFLAMRYVGGPDLRNILVSARRPSLPDRLRAHEAHVVGLRLTRTGQFLGTPDHIAPEQVQTGKVDGRADLSSLASSRSRCCPGSSHTSARRTSRRCSRTLSPGASPDSGVWVAGGYGTSPDGGRARAP